MPYSGLNDQETAKLDKCVGDLMAGGKHDKASAIAICRHSLFGDNQNKSEGRNFDPNVGGGTNRDTLPAEDFAGKNRSFPIKTPQDVADAATSIGRAGPDNYNTATLKQNIIRIAKRKGQAFVDKLPKAWRDGNPAKASQEGDLLFVPVTASDMRYVHSLLGAQVNDAELLKFENALLAKEGRNLNGDGVKAEGLLELAGTLPLMAIDDEHHDRRVVGFITNPRVYENQLLIDGIIYARRFPEITAGILAGTKKLSIEAFAEKAECSQCGQVFLSDRIYCEHLQGRRANGATRWLSGLKGFGAGTTDKPAEPASGFDDNHVTFLAAIEEAKGIDTVIELGSLPLDPDGQDGPNDALPGGDPLLCNPTEEPMDEELTQLQATLATVKAELEAKSGELTQAQAKIATLEAQLQAGVVNHARSLELLEAGFTRAEVAQFEAKLSETDEAVFNILKATKTEATKNVLAANLSDIKPEKVEKPKQAVLGGDSDMIDLKAYQDIFA